MVDPQRVACVWCLDWPIVAAGIPPSEPGAVLHANRVGASSEAARSVGVVRGLRRREAQGRCPELVIAERDLALVKRDLARGYISAEVAARDYGLSAEDIAAVEAAVRRGEPL